MAKIGNANDLADTIDKAKVERGVTDDIGEIAYKLYSFVKYGRDDDGEKSNNKADNENVSESNRKFDAFSWDNFSNSFYERVDSERDKEGGCDYKEALGGVKDKEGAKQESKRNEPKTNKSFCIEIDFKRFLGSAHGYIVACVVILRNGKRCLADGFSILVIWLHLAAFYPDLHQIL